MALGSKPLLKTDRIKAACGGILPILRSICTGPTKVQHPIFSDLCGIRWLERIKPKNTRSSKVDSPRRSIGRSGACTRPLRQTALNVRIFHHFRLQSGREDIKSFTKEQKIATCPSLKNADILWLGQGEICEDKYRLTKKTGEQDQSVCKKRRGGYRFGARQR